LTRLNKLIFRFILTSAGIAVLYGIVSCVGSTTVINMKPVNTGDISISDLIKKNRHCQARFDYLKAVTTLNLESPRSSNQVTANVAIKYPDSVYIKLEGILGIDGLVASINRDSFVVYNIINKYVIKGKTDSSGIRKAFDYEVSFNELIEVLTGLVFIPEKDTGNVIRFEADSCCYVLTLKEPVGYRKVWIDPGNQYAIVKIEHYNFDHQIIMQKEFSRFEKIQNIYLPRYVRIYRPAEKDLLSIYFNERIINKKFDSRLFIIRYPKHIEVIHEK
jgi:hypothetical protein